MILSNLSKNFLKNSSRSIIYKVINIIITLYLVRITLDLLTIEQYAFWIVFLSILAWINMLDFGLGQGFRNLYTDSIILNNKLKSSQLVSSLYFLNFIFSVLVASIFIFLLFVLDLKIFEINNLVPIKWFFYLLCIFLVKYIFRSVSYLLLSTHRARFNMLLILFENVLALLWVLICFKFNELEFIYFILGYITSQLIAVIIFSYFVFRLTDLNLPKFKHINVLISKKIIKKGLNYFVLQLVALLLFGSLPYLISLFFKPLQVVEFGITWRLFSAIVSFIMIAIGPLWSLFKEAKTTFNISWMKNVWFKSIYFCLISVFVLGLSLFVLADFMELWLGKNLNLEISYFLPFGIYACLMAWSGFHSQILNGFGKLKSSIISSLFQGITFFILNFVLISDFTSPHSVIYILVISFVFPAVILPITSFKLINVKND